jgi:glycosyltransferase involved in cell wall biosynthesis
MKAAKLSIVIPIFNNAGSLELLVKRVLDSVEMIDEIIMVDDGSMDNSWYIIKELSKKYAGIVKGIKFAKNYSQAIATIAGLTNTNSDVIICISADLQDPPELIQQLVKEHDLNSVDIVIAHREKREEGIFTKLMSYIAYYFARLECPQIPRGGYDFFLISNRVREILINSKNRNRFPQSEILNTGLPFLAIPYTRNKREIGTSGYTLTKKFRVFIDIILSETATINKIFTKIYIFTNLIGLLFYVFLKILNFKIDILEYGIIYLALLVNLKIVNQIVSSVVISRIYEEQKGRPLYVIQERC